jgi:hypothetical protein
MPLFGFAFGVICIAVGAAYLFSPRFVEWTLTKDQTGRMWARKLGHDRAAVAMRFAFSAILIGLGAIVCGVIAFD